MQAMILVSGGTCFGLGARGEKAIVGIFLEELKCETKPFSSATMGRSVNLVDV